MIKSKNIIIFVIYSFQTLTQHFNPYKIRINIFSKNIFKNFINNIYIFIYISNTYFYFFTF
ncbi:hypothetical protein [Acinetobacter baumannii]|uniref:hypothetical protein n=1 Tax=Acinetobacter calcoaceticus/baumannii complex TaxID=909768 RepID=UPI003528D274